MAVIISVVSGGSVVQAQQLGSEKNGVARISAIGGARYVLADTQGGGAAAGVTIKRLGKNLVIGRDLDGAEQEALIIEDYYGSGGQLVAQAADGSYQEYMAVTDGGAVDAAQMSDGASSALTLVAAQPTVLAGEFQFSEGGSSLFGSALASAAVVAGGVALSTGRDGGSKASAAPAASALVLEDRLGGVATGQPTPAIAGEDVVATVNDAVLDTDSNAVIESGKKSAAEAASASGSNGAVATVAPFAVGDIPVIDKVVDDYGIIQGVVENGGYTDDGYPTIMGKADPGVKVHIYRNTFLLNYVIADANGEWSYTSTTSFASGKHSITIVHEYPNKEISEPSAPYVITVDKIPPAIPVITGIVDDVGRITGAITDQTITDDNRPTISGKAEAHAKVIVYDKGKEIGSTTAGADGKWSFTPDVSLADGVHMLSYSALDRAGNSSQQTAVTEFFVDTRPEKINMYYADDNVGSVTGEVFSGGITDDRTPTLFGTATAGGIVKIYEGSVLLGQVTADVDGTWQFTPSAELSEGAHTFHATVTLVAKGESDRSKPFNLEVDITPPAKPTIDQVWDDVGAVQGAVENGKVTDDNTPTLRGKAEAGSTVHIYDGAILLGSVVADASGKWTYTPGTPLIEGKHDFTVTASDKAGNLSGASDVFNITIGTLPPTQTATVTDIGKDSGFSAHDYLTNDGSAGRLMQGKLSAALNADEKLQVSTDGGLTWASALVDGTHWALQDGNFHVQDWVIKTRVVDGNGQAGEVRDTNVRFDGTAPKSPVAVKLSGTDVIVEFDKNNVVPGDKINLYINDKSMVYTLTEADVAASQVVFLNKAQAKVAIDFEPGRMGGVTVEVNEPIMWSTGFGAIGKGLWLSRSSGHTQSTFTLPGSGASLLSVNIGGLEADKKGYVEFYNKQGELIGRDDTLSASYSFQTIRFAAPAGEVIHSFKIFTPDDSAGIVVDDLQLDSMIGAGFVDAAGNVSSISSVNEGAGAVPLKQSVSLDVDWYFSNKNGTEFKIDESVVSGGKVFNIEGGRGIDTVKLNGAGSDLNLSEFAGQIHSVEIFDITGTGNNTLTLNLVNVLDNGAVNAFYTGDKSRVQMMVKGNAGDKVNLSDLLSNGADVGDWAKKAAVVIGGMEYTSYQHSSLGAELLVQQGVTVVLDNHASIKNISIFGAETQQDSLLLQPAEIELFASESMLLGPIAAKGSVLEGDGIAMHAFNVDLPDQHQVLSIVY